MDKLNAIARSLTVKLKPHARHLWLLGLAAGFIFDFFTLWRIDLPQEELIFFFYLVLAGACIAYMSLRQSAPLPTLALQFAFGGLLGRFFIFYSRSGVLATSWPFLFLLGALFAGNEVLRKRYSIFTFRILIYFIVLFSFAIFYLPILLDRISTGVFLLSGLVSLVIAAAFSGLLLRQMDGRLAVSYPRLAAALAGVYLLINFMYFANLIPPLPLSVVEAGIYHEVRKEGGDYFGVREQEPWYAKLRDFQIVNLAEGGKLYAFSAIFAPTHISTTVYHLWQYYDPKTRAWLTRNQVFFSIVGGRDGGYRGYSQSRDLAPGDWRVDVLTKSGQLIGRIQFKVVSEGKSLALVWQRL